MFIIIQLKPSYYNLLARNGAPTLYDFPLQQASACDNIKPIETLCWDRSMSNLPDDVAYTLEKVNRAIEKSPGSINKIPDDDQPYEPDHKVYMKAYDRGGNLLFAYDIFRSEGRWVMRESKGAAARKVQNDMYLTTKYVFQEALADEMLQVLKICENRLEEYEIEEWWVQSFSPHATTREMGTAEQKRAHRIEKRFAKMEVREGLSDEWKEKGRLSLLKYLVLYAQTSGEGHSRCACCPEKARAICNGCKIAKFCSQKCLAKTWKSHKQVCHLLSGQTQDYNVSLHTTSLRPLLKIGGGMLGIDFDVF